MKARLFRLLKYPASNENGAAMILALIMVAAGFLLIIPLLGFVGSAYKTTAMVYDQKAYELYAAEAGVQDALWRIQNNIDLPAGIGNELTGSPGDINGKDVQYTIKKMDPALFEDPEGFKVKEAYRITSTAANTSITTDTLVLEPVNIFTRKAITCNKIEADNGVIISGPISYSDGVKDKSTKNDGFISAIKVINGGSGYSAPKVDFEPEHEESTKAEATAVVEDGEITRIYVTKCGSGYDDESVSVTITDANGTGAEAKATVMDTKLEPVEEDEPIVWPAPIDTRDYFYAQLPTPIPMGPINLVDLADITGPVYYSDDITFDGDTFDLPVDSGNGEKLIYVDGKVKLSKGKVNLNGYTIFSTCDDKYAIEVAVNGDVEGPGALIAIGDIYFAPKSNNDQYLFVMSISGTTQIQPSGNFVGSAAGDVSILKSGSGGSITWTDPGQLELNLFPGGGEGQISYNTADWIIK